MHACACVLIPEGGGRGVGMRCSTRPQQNVLNEYSGLGRNPSLGSPAYRGVFFGGGGGRKKDYRVYIYTGIYYVLTKRREQSDGRGSLMTSNERLLLCGCEALASSAPFVMRCCGLPRELPHWSATSSYYCGILHCCCKRYFIEHIQATALPYPQAFFFGNYCYNLNKK